MDYQTAPKDNTIFWIEVTKIKPNSQQPRHEFDESQLKELADSIKQYGILQPLLVTRKEEETENGVNVDYELIAGERRLRAAKIAGLTQVPVIIRKEPAEKVKLELALIENIQREDLNTVDKAIAFKQLADQFNMKQYEIAQKVGKSRVYVTNTMRVLNLPEEIKEALKSGKISEGHTRPLLMLSEKPDDQKQLFLEIMERKMNVRDAEKISRRIAYERARKQEGLPYFEEMRSLESSLTNILGTRVFIDRKGNAGKIMIDFASVNQLNNLFKLVKLAKETDIFGKEENKENYLNLEPEIKESDFNNILNDNNFSEINFESAVSPVSPAYEQAAGLISYQNQSGLNEPVPDPEEAANDFLSISVENPVDEPQQPPQRQEISIENNPPLTESPTNEKQAQQAVEENLNNNPES